MKNLKLIAVCCVAAISGSIAVGMGTAEQTCSNDLQVQNIEALSYNEYGYDRGCEGPGDGCTTDWNVWHPDEKGWS